MKKTRLGRIFSAGMLLALILALVTPVYADGTYTPCDSVSVVASSSTSSSMSNGSITVTRKGNTTSANTATITITNTAETEAVISFTYSFSDTRVTDYSAGSLTIGDKTITTSGTTDTYKTVLAAKGIITLELKSPSTRSRVSTVVLSNFSWSASSSLATATVYYDESKGSVTLAGAAVSNSGSTTATDYQLAAAASVKSGCSFIGWIAMDTHEILSTEATATLTVERDMDIQAIFVTTALDTAYFKIGNYIYDSLNGAAERAGNSGTIILLNNGILSAGSYTISSGNTLLIPHDANQTSGKGTEPTYVTSAETQSAFRTLTLENGARITVDGVLEVGGKCLTGTAYNSYRTTGQYGCIAMESESEITVNGTLYAWGYIIGNGNVAANSGAKVYEFIQIVDWRGGNKTKDMVPYGLSSSNDNTEKYKVFPFSQYYVQNIETPLTIYSGANEYVSMVASVTNYLAAGNASKYISEYVTAQFIGSGENGMFRLGSDGYLSRKYDKNNDRMMYELHGNSTLGGISISISVSTTKINVKSTQYNFPVTSNMTINLATGSTVKVDEAQSLAMLPGAEINIDNGAELVVSSSVYVYDADQWEQTYLWAAGQGWTHPVVYSPTRPSGTTRNKVDAKIDVNGTLTVNGQLYTTAAKDDAGNIVGGGANITSSEGTGKVVLNTALTESGKTYQYDQTNEKYVEIPITPAKLKNTNTNYADYTETARAIAGDVFTYHDGVWGSAVIVNATDGYKGGYANLDRAIEYFPTDSTGSTYIKMIGDSTEPRATSVTGKNVYLDLYGKRVELAEGGLTISGTDADGKAYSLYGFDTSGGYTVNATTHAATYTDPKGKIVGTVSGLAKTYQTPETENHAFERYVAITSDGSTTTFHRFNISVTGFHVLLSWQADSKSYAATIFYHATARGDNAVQNAVSGIGFDLDGKQYSAEKKFDTEVDSTIGWGGIVDKSNVNTLYGAKAYLAFGNDTQESAAESHSLYDLLVMAYNSGNLRTGNDKVDAKTVLNQAMKSLGDTIWSNWQDATGQSAA